MRFSSAIDKIGYFLFAACVVVAPIPFGATGTSTAAVIASVLALCLLGSTVVQAPGERAGRLLQSAAVLSVVVVLSSLAQVMPWQALSDFPSAWMGQQPQPNEPAVSLPASRYQSLHAVGSVLVPLVGFMCALAYIRGDRRYVSFVKLVLAANAAIALVCLCQHILWPRSLLWADKNHYLGSFTGTFVNPNTAATYFGFLLLVALSFALRHAQSSNLHRLFFSRHQPGPQERGDLKALLVYGVAAFIFGVALVLTKSRAGILSSFAGVVTFTAASVYFNARARASAARAVGLSALAVLATVAVFAAFGERVLLRMETLGLIEEGRLCTYAATWKIIKDNPWLGTGLGTFQDAFPGYRLPSCGLYGYWEMAHSFFLEGWLSLGVVFVACVGFAYYQLLGVYGRGVRDRRRYRFIPLSSLGLLLILTLHSVVDFSLQVPGFALFAAALLGAGAGVAVRDRPAHVAEGEVKPLLSGGTSSL